MKKILLVDDHILFRDGLANIINSQPDYRVVGQAGTAHDSVNLARELRPDIVLMDYGLPDGSGAEATRTIIEEFPNTIVVFLTVFDTDQILFAAIRSGAKGYLLKSQPSAQLLESLRAIERGEAAISGAMTKQILEEFFRLGPPSEPHKSKLSQLTLREFDILKAISAGQTNREIAQRFNVSETTVKNQVHSILFKLGLKNRHEVVWFARQHGILDANGHKQP
jgi:DNA-binding NarL/FixJ family response regulator